MGRGNIIVFPLLALYYNQNKGGFMSKCYVIGLCCFLPLMIFAGVIDYSVTTHASNMKTEMVKSYDYVSIIEYDHLSKPGHPVLPAKLISFVIPPDAQFENLEVLSEQGAYLTGNFNIFPGQKPVPISVSRDEEFTPPDEKIYSLNTIYPNTPVQYVHEGNLTGYRIVSVLITPLRYYPISKRLHLSDHITFRIHYRSGVVKVKAITESQKKLAQKRVKSLVVNDHQVGIFSPPLRGTEGQGEYIIITDPAFVEEFEPLREWKMKKGVFTEIVTTSEIYANYTGIDKPEQIRNFIRAAADSGAMYFLLAGQCDWEHGEEYVPRRDAFVFSWSGYWPDDDTIPCDVYYSDLDGTWDADGDGTYGEMEDSVDLYSNVFVGRAPVKDAEQIEYFVNKVITYETTPSHSFIEKALLPVGNLWDGNHGNGINDTIADTIPDHWQKSKLYEDYGLMSRYIVRDSINQGFHFCHMVGHGNQRAVYYTDGPYYYDTDPDTQTNDSSDAVIAMSIGCMNGAVDYGSSYSNYDCLAERMVNTNKRCATATIMNTRYGWSEAYNEGAIKYSDEFSVWFFRKLFGTDVYHLGEVLAAAKDHLAPKASPDYPGDNATYRWCLYTFTLFGDPELPLWTELPDSLMVTHPPVVDTGPGQFTVLVKDGSGMPLANARVCCYISTQDPEMHAIAYTDAFGTAVVDVSPATFHNDTMYVTVAQHNFIPYQGYTLIHTHGPYVSMSSVDMIDEDDNGQANPGEIIELGVWARNWGQDPSISVYGYLSESDTFASVSISESKYGRIPAGDSSLSRPYYCFSLADDCPNKHTIEFTLEFHDKKGNVWTSYPRVIVYAPILTYQDAHVKTDNNNSDEVLGPGEVADIVVTVKNEGDATAGHVMSMLTSNSPYVMINDPLGFFGTVEPGATADNSSNPYTVTVSDTTPYGAEIDFSIIVMSGVYRDTLDFTLTVYPPILVVQQVDVKGDNNNNGYLEPGETADLIVTFTNDGLATADEVMSILRADLPYITINDSSGTFGSIISGDTADNANDPYTVTADSSTPYCSAAEFSLLVKAGFFYDTLDFTLVLGKFPPSDTGYYYYAYYSSGLHMHSPVFEWVAIDTTQTEYPGTSLDLNDSTSISDRIEMPFTFPYYGKSCPFMKICAHGWINLRGRGCPSNSTNTGIPDPDGPPRMVAGIWDYLAPGNPGQPGDIYYYYDEPNHRFIVEYFKVEHHPSGDHETFEIILYDPEYYPTPTGDGEIVVQYLSAPKQEDITIGIENERESIGIQYYYNGSYHPLAGEITDSFAIKYTTYSPILYESRDGTQSSEVLMSTVSTRTLLHAPYPNPFKEMTVIRYQIAQGVDSKQESVVSLKIYDITGRLVKQFNHLTIQPFNQVIWDGRDTRGRRVPAGIYFVRFEAGDYKKVEKAILLK